MYYVPIESQRQPNVVNPFRVDNWVDLENLQHRTESIVNRRQPHTSQLFSVRVYDPGQYKVILENACYIIYVNVE